MIRSLKTIAKVHVRPADGLRGWRMGWENQMTNIQTIDQVHVRSMDEEDGIG